MEELERYKRQLLLDEIGEKGQKLLKIKSCLVVGAGGLGSPALFYLAAAGVGTIGIIDGDEVEITNLNRQILHKTRDIGVAKSKSAKEKLLELNPYINVCEYNFFLDKENGDEIIKKYDVIIDACDNFETKFLINELCIRNNKAFIHGGIYNFKGQLTTIIPGKTLCLKCLFEDVPKEVLQDDKRKGVIGAIAGVIGSMQALEAIKYLLKIGDLLSGYMLEVNGLNMKIRKIKLPGPNKDCPICS